MKIVKRISFVITFFLCFVIIPFVYGKYTYNYEKTIIVNVSKPTYTVVFHSNDGNDTTTSQNFVYGTSQTLNENTFSRTNYDFVEWNTEIDGSGISYSDEELVNKLSPINNSVVDLYAQWRQELTFTVSGNPSNWTNQDVTLTIIPDIPGTYKYSFDGGTTWQDSPSSTFSTNQTVRMKIKTLDENKSEQVTEVITKIDKVAPSIVADLDTMIVTLDESNSTGLIGAASDDRSGINESGLQLYRSNASYTAKTDLITNTNYFEYPGLYAVILTATDNAGNTADVNLKILVRWPTGGKYVVKKTELDGDDIAGEGLSLSTTPDGLYKDTAATGANVGMPFASKYYYSGADVDNYLFFADTTFRIINVATNDTLKILGDVSDLKLAWQSSKIYDSNTYNTWSTKWWPRGQIYNHEDGESKYKLFTETEKSHLALATFYAGKLDNNNDDISYIVFNEQTYDGGNLGGNESPSFQGYSAYPNVSDFIKASKVHDSINSLSAIDTTTVYSTRQRFKNNSWIDMTTEYWTMNGRRGSLLQNNDFWVIDNDQGGHFESRAYSTPQQYRVVFYITSETILSGDGSSDHPYTVEEDWSWFDNEQVLQ